MQLGLPEGGNATFTLQLQNLEREVSELRETLAVEQRERERLTAKVHSDKGAVGENTMGTLTIAMRELQEAAKADRSVLYELEHHLSEERNARVTVEDDIDSHIERLEQQEKKSLRDVFEVKTEIEHVGTELTAMYAELTKLQQQVVTQLRGEYEDAVRTVDRKYSGLLAGSTGSSEALSLAQQALSRVARLEERVATSEDDHHDQLEELKMIIANQQTEFETRLTRMADETKGLLAAQERKHAQALAAVVAEQKDHSAAIHQCMDMLENEFASNAALQQTEERLAQALDRVGKAAEASHEALAEVGAGLAECNQAMLVVENSAADAVARAEQIGEERAVWERTAETAMDDMEAELQGKMATFESETHVFEDMVRRKLLDIVRLIPRPVNTF
jgi:chromosome segregation ATPase